MRPLSHRRRRSFPFDAPPPRPVVIHTSTPSKETPVPDPNPPVHTGRRSEEIRGTELTLADLRKLIAATTDYAETSSVNLRIVGQGSAFALPKEIVTVTESSVRQ